METITKQKTDLIIWETFYDVNAYIQNEIDFFKKDKQEFCVSILGDEEKDPKTITDIEIKEHFENDYYIGEYHFEYFRDDLEEEFKQHIGKTIYVEGRNMGWRNRTGHKEFVLNKGEDIFHEIAPECDLTYYITKREENEYELRMSHHDSPTGEYYTLKIK
tara:strand:+ start:86 stop:568 length:483 start_codon:yes stop_codon:yes gene_type:complete